MLTVVMVCRVSPEFGVEHFWRLCHQARNRLPDTDCRIICLSDATPGMRERYSMLPYAQDGSFVHLTHSWPGWWSMLEMYRIPGPAIYLDLDTTIVGDLTPLAEAAMALDSRTVLMLKPFALPTSPLFRTGIVAWGAESRVASAYWAMEDAVAAGGTFEPSYVQEGMTRAGPFHGWLNSGVWKNDETWAVDKMRRAGMTIRSIQEVLPGFVASYKLDVKTGKAVDPSIICYHGRPRPWEVEANEAPAKCASG